MVKHLLPRLVELSDPLLHKALLGQGHHLLGRLVGARRLLEPRGRRLRLDQRPLRLVTRVVVATRLFDGRAELFGEGVEVAGRLVEQLAELGAGVL